MPKKYVFNLAAQGVVMERQLERAHKEFAAGEVPYSIWRIANDLLADEARQLAFNSRRSYIECRDEVVKRKPHLCLGITGYQPDKRFSGVEFTQEDSHVDA